MLSRRGLISSAAVAATVPVVPATAAAGGTLRIAMTAADIPTTHGIPNNGFEGFKPAQSWSQDFTQITMA